MSPALATTLGLALYAAALLPAAAATFLPHRGRILTAYAAGVLALCLYHTGILQRASLAPTDMIVRSAAFADDAQCRKILELMRESGLEVDRSDPDAPKVIGTGADQIPLEVRDVLLACTAGAEAAATPSVPVSEPR